jgi:ComEC/Rec2-related protein
LAGNVRDRLSRLGQPLFLLSASACGGILAADALAAAPAWLWLGAAAVVLAFCLRQLSPLRVHLLVALVFAFAHRVNDHDAVRKFLDSRPSGIHRAEVEGIVMDAPEPEPAGGGWRFPVQLQRFDSRPSASRLLVRMQGAAPPAYGDQVKLFGVALRARAARNPGEFDSSEYLRRQSIAGEFEVRHPADMLLVSSGHGSRIMEAAIHSRQWIARTVTEDIADAPEIAATVRAMVLGTRETTPQDIQDAFVASGTMHIFAVSGLHVALFSWVLWQIVRVFGLRRGWTLGIVIPLMFFYVYVTGLRPSAWRAAIMATVFMCAPVFQRRGDIFNNLGAAALLLLGWDTQQLFQPGFQLSFGVMLALALLAHVILRPLAPLYTHDPFLPKSLLTNWQRGHLWVRKKICESLAVSTASTIGSAPLMIHHFKLVSPIGIVANLFLVFLSFAILFTACLSILCALAKLSWMVPVANNANFALAGSSIWLAKVFAAIPGGHVRMDPARWFDTADCRITVLALQDGGGASHIDTRHGHWLADCGGASSYSYTVRPYLLTYPVSRLDGLILTHRDAAHTAAAGELRQAFPTRALWRPAELTGAALESLDSSHPWPAAGEALSLTDSVRLRSLAPASAAAWPQADDRCAVFLLECRGWRILFMNDAGFLTEKELLESGADIRADVLVKGRHASDLSGLPEFLNAVAPRAIVFSNARFPSEERVSPAWIRLVENKKIAAFDQLQTGAVTIEIRPETLTLAGFANTQRLTLTKPPPPPAVNPPPPP